MKKSSIPFASNSAKAAGNLDQRDALRRAMDISAQKRVAGTPPEFAEWRDKASQIRSSVLENLNSYVDRFEASAKEKGSVVHRAADAEQARRLILQILTANRKERVVKGKSMLTEEIHLNEFLVKNGISVLETDLGEFIVQLAGEPPSHILAPALHKSRFQIGKLFAEKLNIPYDDDPSRLTEAARKHLRNEFLSSDCGITGANFAIAETGSIVLFSNEGNIRMATTLYPLHIAVVSIEKMLPKLADLPVFTRLLPRSATGQAISTYVSVISGPEPNSELHIILLDNGRSTILETQYREILKCIRCSVCLNNCPVYRVLGGHAYESTYPGPMGMILTNLLEGMDRGHTLLDASTLCGVCGDLCPVKVPLPKLIRKMREERVGRELTPWTEKLLLKLFGAAVSKPNIFKLMTKAAPHLKNLLLRRS